MSKRRQALAATNDVSSVGLEKSKATKDQYKREIFLQKLREERRAKAKERYIALAVIVLVAATLVIAILVVSSIAQRNKVQEKTAKELLLKKTYYATRLWFSSDANDLDDISGAYYSSKYRICVFVSSKDKASGHAKDTVVAWPTETTKKILSTLNMEISYRGIDLTPYALSYPITSEDIIKKWADVSSLLENYSRWGQPFSLSRSPSPLVKEDSFEHQTLYAQTMRFKGSIEDADLPGAISKAYQSGKYKECVFVSSPDQSKGYSNDVMVAWPTGDTEKILSKINKEVLKEKTNLKPFSLSYPITILDITKKWRNVDDLTSSFDWITRRTILNLSSAD